jgi:hypothetical protein
MQGLRRFRVEGVQSNISYSSSTMSIRSSLRASITVSMSSGEVVVRGQQFVELVEGHKALHAAKFDGFPDNLAASHFLLLKEICSY